MEWVKKKLEKKKANGHGHGLDVTKATPLFTPTLSPQDDPDDYTIQEPPPLHHVHVHGHAARLSGRSLSSGLRAVFSPPRRPYPPLGPSVMTATLFGFSSPSCRVHLAVQADGPRSDVLTVLQLAITTDAFAAVHASGTLEFVLRCGKSLGGEHRNVWQERAWMETCNGVSYGEAGLAMYGEDGVKPYVLQLLEPMALGVGLVAEYEDRGTTGDLMYIRAPVRRSKKATEDYERLHLLQLGDLGFNDLTFCFMRE